MDKNKNAAFLWDESFLWGLMAYRALTGLALPFDLLKADDIKKGALNGYKMLFVPGGWASNKSRALGENGIKAVQDFVANGGNYLGFCGGAGLATKSKGGIGLLNVKRRPTKERVPSFSGRIELNLEPHPIWRKGNPVNGQRTTDIFHAWWPSQFVVDDDVKILATYGQAMSDAFSSDLNVGDTNANGNWTELESVYQINLDPRRLFNEPSVLEGSYGKGKVILSLVHFDTPDDINGQTVLRNLWGYLAGQSSGPGIRSVKNNPVDTAGARRAVPLQNLCAELIAIGERNFLWFWRNPMLLQWKRGVRGLEYNSLFILVKAIAEILENRNTEDSEQSTDDKIEKIKGLLIPFIEKSKRLLMLERHALQKGHITYEKCDDREIQGIRKELFSGSKSYGGMFKELIDEVDGLLFLLMDREHRNSGK